MPDNGDPYEDIECAPATDEELSPFADAKFMDPVTNPDLPHIVAATDDLLDEFPDDVPFCGGP